MLNDSLIPDLYVGSIEELRPEPASRAIDAVLYQQSIADGFNDEDWELDVADVDDEPMPRQAKRATKKKAAR